MSIPDFETREITKPIMDFIKTCPFLEKYNIDMSRIGVQKVLKEVPDGSAIDFTGSTMVSNVRDLLQKRYALRQANFNIWLLRDSKHDVQREEIAEFLFNFEQWVEHCQAYGITPKISQTRNDAVEEFMWADSGAYFSEWENENSSLYLVQLHINYINDYL